VLLCIEYRVTRKAGKNDFLLLTTHFYTKLELEGPEAVRTWNKGRGIDIFKKKLILIPSAYGATRECCAGRRVCEHDSNCSMCVSSCFSIISVNGGLHWSLCVVVNPGKIMERVKLKEGPMSEEERRKPMPCILLLDSLGMHDRSDIAGRIRQWLNCEWASAKSVNEQGDREQAPYGVQSMIVSQPRMPRQLNGYDCGIFVCRFAYGLLKHLGKCEFTYEDAGFGTMNGGGRGELFSDCLAAGGHFRFDQSDVTRMRGEMKTLINNLSQEYKETETTRAGRQRRAARLNHECGED